MLYAVFLFTHINDFDIQPLSLTYQSKKTSQDLATINLSKPIINRSQFCDTVSQNQDTASVGTLNLFYCQNIQTNGSTAHEKL